MRQACDKLPFATILDKSGEFSELVRCLKENITPINIIGGGTARAPRFCCAKKA